MESSLALAARVGDIAPFHVMEVQTAARALEAAGRSVVHMEIGEPDFPTPGPVLEAARRALADGGIDLVASDHSPCPPVLKQLDAGDFFAAWGGIASLELSLPATWTGARARGHGLPALARWLALAPARLAGIAGRKGRIVVGGDADLVIFEPDTTWTVDPRRLQHRHPVTPYAGRELVGRVTRTWLRGRCVFDNGAFPSPPAGEWLTGREQGAGSRGVR